MEDQFLKEIRYLLWDYQQSKRIIISDETGYEKPHIHNFKNNSGFISKKKICLCRR